MKIGVLTFHQSINNGAVVQCYSLCKRIKQEFPNDIVEVVDYQMPIVEDLYLISLRKYFRGTFASKAKKSIRLLQNPFALKQLEDRRRAFLSVRNVLPLSHKKIFSNDTNELFEYINDNYDIVIAGSDAIWNYNLRGFPNPYFLDASIKCPKLSYAASCYGMNYEKIDETRRSIIKNILDSYCFLGVRDCESEQFIKFIRCNREGTHTCDPTVFLDINDLPVEEELFRAKLIRKGFCFRKQSIGVMGDDKMCNMIRSLYGEKYQIVSLYNYCRKADVNLHDINPFEWAFVFRYFKLTFTTYFHGTLLSLRNGVPVIAIALETDFSKNHKTKVDDFLTRVSLSDCYFHVDYKTQDYSSVKIKADELLARDMREQIIDAMDTESKHVMLFIDTLKQLHNN